LRKNIHGVVDLNVHVIANRRKFLSLVRDQDIVLGLDLVCRVPFDIESPDDGNGVTIKLVLVRFVAAILEDDGNLRHSAVSR